MIYAINNRFARRAPVPPLSHTPVTQPETPVQRMHGLIKQGWPRDSIAVTNGQLVLVRRESYDFIPL